MLQKIFPKVKILLSKKWIKPTLLSLLTKTTIKLKLKIYYLILSNLRNLNSMRISNLIFYTTVQRNSKISVKRHIKKSVSLKKENYSIYPTGSKPGILYGSTKIHKPIIHNCSSFQHILSTIGTPRYSLSRFLVPIFSPLPTNEFTVYDSLSCAEEVANFDTNCVLASLDVESPFTNIPLYETIENCINDLFSNNDTVYNFLQFFTVYKEDLKELLKFASYE